MAEIFSDKIQYQVVTLYSAADIAKYNFKFQTSVEYLDLSANFPIQLSSFKESILRSFRPEREILYRLHLDTPRNLEDFCCKSRTDNERWKAFHIKEIRISDRLYYRNLESWIVESIENDRNKVDKQRSFIKLLKFLNFGIVLQYISVYFRDNILSMLYAENCSDFELLRNFLTMFDFTEWLRNRSCPRVLEYVLLQAQRACKMNFLWQLLDSDIDPANFCFFLHKIQIMLLLLKYGIIASFPSYISLRKWTHPLSNIVFGLIRRKNKDKRRAFFLFQLWYDFRYHKNSPEGLQCLWSSMNDPFLCRNEVENTFKKKFAKNLIEHYQKVTREDCSLQFLPRTLKAICRVKIRRLLSANHQLPFGVHDLEIHEDLKSYINLFL